MTFEDLLSIEKSAEIMKYRFEKSDLPLFLPIRFFLYQSIINQTFHLSNPHIAPKRTSLSQKILYAFHTLRSNLFLSPPKDILIFSSGIVNVKEMDIYVNRLYHPLSALFPDQTRIIESSVKRGYLLPKKDTVYFRDLMDIIIVIASKMTSVKPKDRETIDSFISYLRKSGAAKLSEETMREIRRNLIQTSKRIGISISLYRKYLQYQKPRMIIIEDGHYGGYGFLCKLARELGIITAEYQHGYIGLGHPAYHYGSSILNEVAPYLPEYFLTHGQYWSDRIRIPGKTVEIGFPYLSEKLAVIEKPVSSKQILFISGGTVCTDLYRLVDSTAELLSAMGYSIVLRPHPSEQPAIEERYGSLIGKNVRIDQGNLYDTLRMSEIVISLEVSTVLFEAVNFTKKIYLMKTPYTTYYEPESVFLDFSDAAELIEGIQKRRSIDHQTDYFWNSGWRINYRNFIQTLLGTKK